MGIKKLICAALAMLLLTASLASCELKSDDETKSHIYTSDSESEKDNVNSQTNTQISSLAAYDSIISVYQKTASNALLFDHQKDVENIYDDTFDLEKAEYIEWYNKIFESCLSYRSYANRGYGYSISDINDDGIDELILMLEDHTILAIFSMSDSKPILLDSFTSTYKGCISADGNIYTSQCNTPTTTSQRVYRISETCEYLEQLSEIGTDHLNLERGTGCYKLVDGEKVAITLREYEELYYALFKNQPLWETEIQIKDNTDIQFTPLALTDCNPNAYDSFFNDFIANNPIDVNFYEYCEENTSNSLMLPTIQWSQYWYDEFDQTLTEMNVLFDDKAAYEAWKTKMTEWREYIQAEFKIDGENLYGTLPREELSRLYGRVIRKKVIELKYDMFTAGIADPTVHVSWYVNVDYVFEAIEENTDEMNTDDFGEEFIDNIPEGFMNLNSHFSISNTYFTSHPLRYRDICGAFTEQDHPIIYVKSWNEYLELPVLFKWNGNAPHKFNHREACATLISENTGIFIAIPDYDNDSSLTVVKFTKGSDEYSVSTLNIEMSKNLGFNNLNLYCNFIDQQIGFLFAFEVVNPYDELAWLYKTTDGGESWSLVEFDSPVYFSYKDFPIYAEFINEDIGVMSGRCAIVNDMEERTYITYDGGNTWELFPHISCEEDTYIAEIIDINCNDGIYTMYAVISVCGEESGVISRKLYSFTSTDMKSWSFDKELARCSS